MSRSVETRATGPTDATRAAAPDRPRVRHGYLAGALVVVALFRATEADWIWAGVLGLAAVTELALLLLERRRRTARLAEAGARPAAVPTSDELETSVAAHRQRARAWAAGLGLTLVCAVALVSSAPSLAAVLAVVALVALARLRRERRTLGALHLLRDHRSGPGGLIGGVA